MIKSDIDLFVLNVIQEIKDGIIAFNSNNTGYKAFFPESIDFDIAHDNGSHIKFTIITGKFYPEKEEGR